MRVSGFKVKEVLKVFRWMIETARLIDPAIYNSRMSELQNDKDASISSHLSEVAP